MKMIKKSLIELSSNQEAEIITINGGWIMQARLKELGLSVGQKIKRISRVGVNGPVIVLINRTQIAVGAGVASRITVRVKYNAQGE